jgi:hypothetical protein
MMVYYWVIGTPLVALSKDEDDEVTQGWWSYAVLPREGCTEEKR